VLDTYCVGYLLCWILIVLDTYCVGYLLCWILIDEPELEYRVVEHGL